MILLFISFDSKLVPILSDIHKLFCKFWIIFAKESYRTCIILIKGVTYVYIKRLNWYILSHSMTRSSWFSTVILPAPKMITLPNILLSEKFENLRSKLGYLFILKSSWKCICQHIRDKNVPLFTPNISKRVKQVLWSVNLKAFVITQSIYCRDGKRMFRYCAINFFQIKCTKIQSTIKIKEKSKGIWL